ncbi:MAG TPA: Gfo/Idh/MocA family oxidoreductase [Mycobacteriales bacterium]|jgi:predicted dehydrogenase|nr:Gfo/Idh/MocA family oxidoreductase [Mycobacteriales bacterium]
MRWGILGPGRISRSFLTGLAGSATEHAVAVGSRDLARAEAAAQEFGVDRAYGSYEELLADDTVEAVYVGTPNSVHAPWAIAAAAAGKHVLCEKPLGVSPAEAESMFTAAREHGVRLMEAFMYRFHPRTLRLAELVAAGDIGTPTLVRASFGFAVADTANVRLSADLAGGALMDVGCYPVNAARMLAGPVARASANARWQDVDVTLAGLLDHEGGALSLVSCSLVSGRHNVLQVIGADGVIDMPEAFTPPKDQSSTLLVARGTKTEELTFPPVDQYTAEAEGFAALVAAGHDADLPQMPLVESLDNARTIEALLASAR